jgi:alanine dehydrogenase
VIVGVPRETKEGERRVALLPEAVEELVAGGDDVQVETQAGAGIGVDDATYRAAGATVVTTRDAWDADLVVKVKEMQPRDFENASRGASIFSYHHLTGAPQRTRALAALGATAIAWEAIHDARGRYPLLEPMSRIAGRMAADIAPGLLGRAPQRVLVLGAGHASLAAARAAAASGAQVAVLTRSERTRDAVRAGGLAADIATPESIEHHALEADAVIAAVFQDGLPTPKLLPRALVARMKRGALIIDISIEEGGVAETSRRTTHAQPTYVEEGVIHYCVGNMPAARPREASAALSQAALPYILDMERDGVEGALAASAELRSGLQVWRGRVAHAAIAAEAGLPHAPPSEAELAEAAEDAA